MTGRPNTWISGRQHGRDGARPGRHPRHPPDRLLAVLPRRPVREILGLRSPGNAQARAVPAGTVTRAAVRGAPGRRPGVVEQADGHVMSEYLPE